MDARKYMVVDLQQRGTPQMFLTERVENVKCANGKCVVSFFGQPETYTYSRYRLLFLKNPEKIDLKKHSLYIRDMHITNASEAYLFRDKEYAFWYIADKNGRGTNAEGRDIYLSRTDIRTANANVWKYLNQVVEETGIELKTEDAADVLNPLKKQYDLVDTKRDNVPLANYLGLKNKLATTPLPSDVIYPFGCNASQKQAVENALTNQVSIIQGPPGTGKTQTILNIIANLLVAGKTVLVVSNNNSAVDNVAEKLSRSEIGLDFIVAKLGKAENKSKFFASQPIRPDLSNWKLHGERAVKQDIRRALNVVMEGFKKQERLSQILSEMDALKTEEKYNASMLVAQNTQSIFSQKPSQKLLTLSASLHALSDLDKEKNLGFFQRIKWTFSLGLPTWKLLKKPTQEAIFEIETSYYAAKHREITEEISEIESFLQNNDISANSALLQNQSLRYLKSIIQKRYKSNQRKLFDLATIKRNSPEFLKEFPVVLSTTYSAKSNISKDFVFDYVIMDEASQVDIATGALSLSCAKNAVIVGDDKQLPNVIDSKSVQALVALEKAYSVEDSYRITAHSFLESCKRVFHSAPSTLLREHYRCRPKIIEFCNKMFYDGELRTMTAENNDSKTLSVMRTVKGNHARGNVNQREIDVITNEVLTRMKNKGTLGIITPYKNQANAINQRLSREIASTVHKYQGRECDTIIMSMVDNTPTPFSDDANLLNVAISRAKSRLCIVCTGNELPENSLLSQLIGYIRYNNFDVSDSQLYSVFDILYTQYTQLRLEYEKRRKTSRENLGFLSENIVFDALTKALDGSETKTVGILAHYPLARLVANTHSLSQEQQDFVKNPHTHVDFLLYNTVSKSPLACIEVDGWKFHNTDAQKHRDNMKDEILSVYGLKPIRLSTTSLVTVKTLKKLIGDALMLKKSNRAESKILAR